MHLVTHLLARVYQVWEPHIESVIQTQFKKIGKGWCDFSEQTLQAYEQGRMKKFMTLINQLMNDTILFLAQKTFKEFYDYFNFFIPESIAIKGTYDIQTKFKNGFEYDSNDDNSQFKHNYVRPLFYMELMKSTETQQFYYSTDPKQIQITIEMIFDRLLDDLNKIPSVEKSMLHDLYRKAAQLKDVYIKAPQRQKDLEKIVFQQRGPLDWDENQWITDIYEKLSKELGESLKPLEQYLQFYDQYKPILALNPEELVKNEYQNEENQKEVDAIKEEIKQYYQKEKKVRAEMKDQVQVSYFLIDCKDTVK